MLKSFLISFFCTFSLILITACQSMQVQERLEQEKTEQLFKVLNNPIKQLKVSNSCNNIQAIADIMFGEGENQTLPAKYDLGYFLINESIKDGKTLCEELKIRMPGGALKYSSMHHNLKYLKKKRAKSYQNIYQQAKVFWNNHREKFSSIQAYNHYITTRKARFSPPEWFKYYIVSYKISGDHVFVNLDFEKKKEIKASGKYMKNYYKMIQDIKKGRK